MSFERYKKTMGCKAGKERKVRTVCTGDRQKGRESNKGQSKLYP